MSKNKSIEEMSSTELKVAHYNQRMEIEKSHKILNLMNENLNKIQAGIFAAEEREAQQPKSEEPKAAAPKPAPTPKEVLARNTRKNTKQMAHA